MGELTIRQIRIGQLWIDALTLADALEELKGLVESGAGGAVFTPNVDHVVFAERDAPFRAVYERASLSLVDGAPVLWTSRLLRTPLPAKVSGSDFIRPASQLAAREGWRIYLVGGAPGVAEKAADTLRLDHGANVVGVDAPFVDSRGYSADEAALVTRIRAARPHLVFVALGSPKQEFWIDRVGRDIRPAVALGVGASLDFIAGTVRRAPPWASRSGLEWLYRLAQEPRRLWRRYLLDDPRYALVALRTMRESLRTRVRERRAWPGRSTTL